MSVSPSQRRSWSSPPGEKGHWLNAKGADSYPSAIALAISLVEGLMQQRSLSYASSNLAHPFAPSFEAS